MWRLSVAEVDGATRQEAKSGLSELRVVPAKIQQGNRDLRPITAKN